jgi:hypothetical protein
MKDLKGFLQKAIITNDMESVREFYTTIFGETAPIVISQPVFSEHQEKLEAIKKILLGDSISNDSYKEVEETEITFENNDTEETNVNPESGVKFISSSEFELPEDSNPTYAEGIKKLATRKKQYRDEYKPNFKNCEVCSTRFDFNKEYPAGLLQSDSSIKIKCNKCRIK